MGTLTQAQKREFKRAGFVVIPNEFGDSLITEWREKVWDQLDQDPDAPPTSYINEDTGFFSEAFDWDLLDRVTERTTNYAEQLLGEGNLEHPDDKTFLYSIRFPDNDGFKQPSEMSPHVDGFGHVGYEEGTRGNSLRAAVYLDRVESRSGGFTVWPGSHWKMADYWETHDRLSYADYYTKHEEPPIDAGDPFEIIGEAGTLILWHGRLIHNPGVRHTLNPRMAAFRAFHHINYPAQYDVLSDPFMLYEGLDDVDIPGFSKPRLQAGAIRNQ